MPDLIQLGRPGRDSVAAPKPSWLKVRMPGGGRYATVRDTLRELKLHTVCEDASCPNVGECWGGGTATVMLMGDVCTRGCRFCDVTTGRPPALDPDEPRHLAEAVSRLGLDYLVVTSVDRDDLPDQGAGHFAAAIRELRARAPHTYVEVLVPDWRGETDCVRLVVDAAPHVYAHNVETVERLQRRVRDIRAGYRQSLGTLVAARKMGAWFTKSSLMLGLGEREDEIVETMLHLREAGVDVLTLGQYLRPSVKHLPVEEYVHPDRFEALAARGRELGFLYVAAGPLVRSSYRAAEFFIQKAIEFKAKEAR